MGENDYLRSSDTCPSSDMKRLQKLPRIGRKVCNPKESFRSELKRSPEKGVVVVKSPMPDRHDGLHDDQLLEGNDTEGHELTP